MDPNRGGRTRSRRRRISPLRRRLLPLHIAIFFQGFALWYAIEKLFMYEIGFQPATVGLMVAAYAAMVPLVEIPSGILADRWSRRGVLVIAVVALMVSTLLGGLSNNVVSYIIAIMVLGIYFAAFSGTLDSIVYDTVLEETGSGEGFEKRIGKVRLLESLALVGSALAGGWLAELTSTRLTYFMSLPFMAISIIALLRFSEPRLHRSAEQVPLRSQIALTYRTIASSGRLRPIVLLALIIPVLLTALYEFSPMWLVALSVAAVFYGPAAAGLTATIGIGGLLAGRLRFDRPATLGGLMIIIALALFVLITSTSPLLVTLAQITLALLAMMISIQVAALLHDAIPSNIRAGVASGVSALSWAAFLPFALLFGLVNQVQNVHTAGWLIAGVAAVAVALLIWIAINRRASRRRERADTPVLQQLQGAGRS